MDEHRSGCPINLTLEVLGDRWSLIVIRDIMFGNRRHFRQLMTLSDEGIASNVLADRLKRLLAAGLLSKRDNPAHKQKAVYSLTEAAIQLVPLLAHMGAWGRRHSAGFAGAISRRLRKRGPAGGGFMANCGACISGTAPERSVLAELRAPRSAALAARTLRYSYASTSLFSGIISGNRAVGVASRAKSPRATAPAWRAEVSCGRGHVRKEDAGLVRGCRGPVRIRAPDRGAQVPWQRFSSRPRWAEGAFASAPLDGISIVVAILDARLICEFQPHFRGSQGRRCDAKVAEWYARLPTRISS
jgi:DNA-binding HxlR family transcriptional regulator